MFTKETLETISKYGFATVAAIVLAWAFYQFNIVPAAEDRADAREERKAAAKALVESNKEAAVTGRSFAQSYEKMAQSFEAQTQILREIRDDQKKFPAVREADAANVKPEQP